MELAEVRQVARMLLERDREILVIEDALARARAGSGSLIVFEGEHGNGKSVLLEAAADLSRASGMGALRATGDELERDFPFGVALQLFEPVLESGEDQSDQLFAGAAGLARPLFEPVERTLEPLRARPDFSILHGLYWLASNLAARQPLLVALDDAHWIDAPSLRFLHYLTKRLDELPIVVVLAAEPGEPGARKGVLAELAAQPQTERLSLRALSAPAAEQLVRSFIPNAGHDLCRACLDVTRGNPLYLSLVAAELRDETNGSVGAAARIRELGSEPIAGPLLARLERLGPDAIALVRATAVMDDVPLRQAAMLASLDLEAASRAADQLISARLLAGNGRLAFAQPIVRNSVLSSLAPAERSRLQLAAAEVLAEESAPAERVATHLLEAQEQGSDWVVETLVDAAERSLGHGAPESAMSYLRRALAEPPSRHLRVRVQLLLGKAEAAVGEPDALDRLGGALELIEEPAARASVRLEIGRALHLKGQHREAAEAFRDGTMEVGPEDDLGLRLRAAHATASRLSYQPAGPLAELEPQSDPVANGSESPVSRELKAHAAFEGTLAGSRDARSSVELAQKALDGGRLLEEEGPDALPFYLAIAALTFAEDLQAAELALAVALDDAQRRGSVVAFATASHFRGLAVLRRGRLNDAAADLQNALASARYGWAFALPATHALLAEAQLARGDVDAAWREVENRAPERFEGSPWLPALLLARGQVQDAMGRPREALADLLEAGRLSDQLGVHNPAVLPWRSAAAVVAHREGDGELAVRLAEEELQAARDFGAPGPQGRALRAIGVVSEGPEAIDRLEEAVALLEGSHAALERALALVDLGAALRRARRRSAAREHLQNGADLARRCGAEPLVARAREELVAAGSRPRRVALTGIEALTPRERQVAELAADGLSNREIAEKLFVTLKTVEWHLRNAFAKLEVGSRTELRAALVVEAAA